LHAPEHRLLQKRPLFKIQIRHETSTAKNVSLCVGENVVAIYWNKRLALQYGIRSSTGYLVTTHGRVCEVRRGINGTIYFESEILPPAGELPRVILLLATEALSSDSFSAEEIGAHLKALHQDVSAKKSPHGVLRSAIGAASFAEACDKLSLRFRGGQLLRDNGCFDCVPMPLAEGEIPLVRVDKSKPCSLVVTSAGRMIWCRANEGAACLDAPMGELLNVPVFALQYWAEKWLAMPNDYIIGSFHDAIKRESKSK
jgi:hypothetical protein